MKLLYWVADCLTDSKRYSIRRRTKIEVLSELARVDCKMVKAPDEPPSFCNPAGQIWANPRKVLVQFADTFDLVCRCLGEGGIE